MGAYLFLWNQTVFQCRKRYFQKLRLTGWETIPERTPISVPSFWLYSLPIISKGRCWVILVRRLSALTIQSFVVQAVPNSSLFSLIELHIPITDVAASITGIARVYFPAHWRGLGHVTCQSQWNASSYALGLVYGASCIHHKKSFTYSLNWSPSSPLTDLSEKNAFVVSP